MSSSIESLITKDYAAGFVTDIEADSAPLGLNEDIVRFISHKKNEPQWMLDWRLKAYRHWLTHVAAGCLIRKSGLGSEFESPEELVNAFLAEKVLPPRQADSSRARSRRPPLLAEVKGVRAARQFGCSGFQSSRAPHRCGSTMRGWLS